MSNWDLGVRLRRACSRSIHKAGSLLTCSQKVEGFLPADDGLKKAMTGADIVVIPAGIPRTQQLQIFKPCP